MSIDTGPGWLDRAALRALEAEQQRRNEAQDAMWRLHNNAVRQGLQNAVQRILGRIVDVNDLSVDSTGRPYVFLDRREFAPLAPTAQGWGLLLILRCEACHRVSAELPIPTLAYLGTVIEEGIADPQTCHKCLMGRRAA